MDVMKEAKRVHGTLTLVQETISGNVSWYLGIGARNHKWKY